MKKLILVLCFLLVATISFFAGYLVKDSNINTLQEQQIVSQKEKHYQCKVCGYEFYNLSNLRLEKGSAGYNHSYYYCPSCGEMLTSNAAAQNALSDEAFNVYGKTIIYDGTTD